MLDDETDQLNGTHNHQLSSSEYDSGLICYPPFTKEMNYSTNTRNSAEGHVPMDCHTPKSHPNRGNENADNEDDPVVHEIPVFLAQSLAKQLFLYQVRYLRRAHVA